MRKRVVGPTGLRKVPEEVIFMQIKPVFASDGVANRITSMGVQHHLGVADRAGGEVDQARIIASRLRAS